MEIIIKISKGQSLSGKEIVTYKQGRKTLGWTEFMEYNRKWCNCKKGYSFSASDTLERAIEVMKEHLVNVLNPFGNNIIKFQAL